MQQFRHRAYDPTTGRWLQEDPVGLAGGVNLYEYSRSDPNTFSDPFGLVPCPPCSDRERVEGPIYSTNPGLLDPMALLAGGVAGKVLGGAAVRVASVDAASAKAGRLAANKIRGDVFRDEIAGLLRASGRDVQTEVTKRTPFGLRRIDIEVSRGGKVLGGIETKTGGSPYTPQQRAKDSYLRLTGYIVDVVRGP